ncbi:unnamed protein product [Somion occarium]|uniref:Acetyl-CoA synthetase-like protein n=2 Tax=Somion occarium TaxID=3059160 RepID=A0ABP1DAP1_9APHY
MANSRLAPPLDGSLIPIPGFIDFQAEHNPNLPWAVFPSAERTGDIDSISFLEFAEATHRIAHAARPSRHGDDGEIIAILVNCDIVLYVALVAGLMRAGIMPFPMSPRNSPEAICNMLHKTGCRRIITQPSVSSLVITLKDQMSSKGHTIRVDDLLALRTVFPGLQRGTTTITDTVEPYPPSSRQVQPDDIVLYIHSSGSTGFPKPIPQTQKITLQWCMTRELPSTPAVPEGESYNARPATIMAHRDRGLRSAAMISPTFHLMGLYSQLYNPLASSHAIAVFTPQDPLPSPIPNAQNTLEVAQLTKCNTLSVVPSFLEQWSHSPEAIEYLKSLKLVRYAGGPLSTATGDKLVAAGVKLTSVYGGTEFGALTLMFDTDDSQGPEAPVKTSADWAWMQFSDQVKCRWIDQGDGTYELQFLTCDTHQPAVENLPDVRGYATADLFEPHPTKKGLWRPVGRLDDVIVLGTGEKIVPIPQEGHIGSLSYVSGAVMFGREKTQAGIIIELRQGFAFDPNDEQVLVAFRNKIWPHVEEANKLAPTFARIFKEMIIVTDPARPMARAGKGTVQRKIVLREYANEIEKLYQTVEESADAKGIAPPKEWTTDEVQSWLSDLGASINEEKRLIPNLDFFEQGFDSLSATFLRNRIIAALRTSPFPSAQRAAVHVAQDFVFAHPTIESLTQGVLHLVGSIEGRQSSRRADIQTLIDKYTPKFPEDATTEPFEGAEEAVVVLTGSSGHLGSHILASLLQQDKVAKVYTFNRGNDVVEKQRNAFQNRGLPVSLLQDKRLVQLPTDLSVSSLGLSPDILHEIKRTATHVIHNAWRVNFNLSLTSFESDIAITHNLLKFALTFFHYTHFVFTSSIAVTSGWDSHQGVIPESVLNRADVLEKIGNGYAGAKYVVEHILARLDRTGALRATSVRIGQLSGSTTTGAWNATEWVPSLVKSSLVLGCLPTRVENVSWIPVDVVASAVVEITHSSSATSDVLNIVHPQPVPWNNVFSDIAKTLGSMSGQPVQLVPYADWLAKLEQYSTSPTQSDLDAMVRIITPTLFLHSSRSSFFSLD